MRTVLQFIAIFHAPLFAQTLPLAPDAEVVDLTPRDGYFNEPSIAIDPHNPLKLVAAWQVNSTAAFSVDGGHHWNVVGGVATEDFRKSGDVSVTFDSRDHAILCSIAFDQLGAAEYWAHGATRNGIFIRRSLDGGKTWETKSIAVTAHPTAPGIPFEDKPYIAADNTNGPHSGNLYIGWTQFTETNSVIMFSRSTDGGLAWSAPIPISTHAGLPRDDNGAVEGFTAAIGPGGAVYAAWADRDEIAFTFSKDGGKHFAHSRGVIPIAPPYFSVAGVSRANGFPVLGVDALSGAIYLTWADYRNGDIDVFCAVSRDHGRHWSSPVRVNNDTIHNGADQFFHWLSIDPVTGAANIVFYDRRGDARNRNTTVTLARSTDGGKTFQNFAWTETAFDTHEDFLGDYTGIAAYDGRVFGIWAEERATEDGPKSHHTVVRVGRADFHASAK